MITKAVIPAAGLGTRFLPATKAIPKEMLPIINKPVIHFVVEEAVASGIKDIVIITGKGKRAVEDYFDTSPELESILAARGEVELLKRIQDTSSIANLYFIRQKNPLGLGDAVLQAQSFIGDDTFAVLLGDNIVLGDTPCIKQLMDASEAWGGKSMIAAKYINPEEAPYHGVIQGKQVNENTYFITKQIEKPAHSQAPSNIATIGRYVFTPKIFDYIKDSQPDKNGEVSLTPATNALTLDQGVYAYIFQGTRYDAGNRKGYVEAIIDFAKKEGLIEK